MPKLWDGTIEAHRREVRAAVLAATATLVAQHGLRGVTMSRIAKDAGIGRATLYKYFPDVESILTEWHDEQVNQHLDHLRSLGSATASPERRLATALQDLAEMSYRAAQHRARGTDVAATMHTSDRVSRAERDLHQLVREMVQDAVDSGQVRDDMPTDELAHFCVTSARGARQLSSQAAVRRLCAVTMTALRR